MLDTYSSVTISIHQFSKWCVLFDFELNNSIVLSQYLQVDVLRLSSLDDYKRRKKSKNATQKIPALDL